MSRRTVREVMTAQVITVTENASFKELATVMAGHSISALPVLNRSGRMASLVCEADLLPKEEFKDDPAARRLPWWRRWSEHAKASGGHRDHAVTTGQSGPRPAMAGPFRSEIRGATAMVPRELAGRIVMYTRITRALCAAAAAGALTALGATAAGSAGAASTAPRERPARPVTAYVVNHGGPPGLADPGTVTPINTVTGKTGKAIKVGRGPGYIAITPDGKTAYVANFGGGSVAGDTVTPISTATGRTGKAIKVGDFPDAIAITPDGRTAYVIAGGRVVPIRTATNRAGKAIKVGSRPQAIAITPNGKTAYVANYGSDTVTPINTATGTALKAIKVGNGPGGSGPGAIAITPDGKTAYVSNFSSGTVTPIRTATNKPGKAIKVGYYPASIAITPDGKTAYVVIAAIVGPRVTWSRSTPLPARPASRSGWGSSLMPSRSRQTGRPPTSPAARA